MWFDLVRNSAPIYNALTEPGLCQVTWTAHLNTLDRIEIDVQFQQTLRQTFPFNDSDSISTKIQD